MKPNRPIWPKIAPRFSAAALAGHSAMGLTFGALIYLVVLTGTLSVLVDEMKAVEQPSPISGTVKPGALNRAVASVLAKTGPLTSLYAIAPSAPLRRLTITTVGGKGEAAFLADPTGRVVLAKTPFSDFVADLHMTLTVRTPWGPLLVGLSGVALLSLILSGALSHPRIFRDAFRLRLGGAERLREAELHNRLSVWGLPFHIVVTLTGAFFGLANVLMLAVAALGFHGSVARLYAPITGPSAPQNTGPASSPDLEALVRRSLLRLPGSRLGYVGIDRPGAAGARIAIEVSAPGRLPRGEDFYYDAVGRPLGRSAFVTGALGLQAYSSAAQLHFGFFGGLPVRLAYVALGCALSFVSASGVTIWLSRQEDRGKAAPRLRRAWLAWTWGVPGALLAAAGLSTAAPPTVVFWSVLVILQAALQMVCRRPPAPRRSDQKPDRSRNGSIRPQG